jgi:hypothetical protein
MAPFVALGSTRTLFKDPDTDPHQSEKLDPEPHQSQNSGDVEAQHGAMTGRGRSQCRREGSKCSRGGMSVNLWFKI